MTAALVESKTTVAFADQSTEELRRELIGLIQHAADNLLRMAALVVELESRGEDLTGLRLSLLPHLRRIATRQLLPEAVVHFASSARLLNQVAQLPVAEQRRLVDKPEVEVYVTETDSVERVGLADLHARQSHAVFGNGRIRTPDEQRVYIRGAAKPDQAAKPIERKYRVRPDREKGGVWIGLAFVKLPDFLAAVSEMAGPLPPLKLDDSDTASARLAAGEKEKLRLAEKKLGLPEHHLIRMALHAYGII